MTPSWNTSRQRRMLALFFVIGGSMLSRVSAQTVDFDKQIAPILVSYCVECHRGAEPEGGLQLTEAALVLQGGDSGAALVAGNAAASLLWERVSSNEMPPKHPLSETNKRVLQQWIEEGAVWGSGPLDLFSLTTQSRAGRDWWSLQPLRNVSPPPVEADWVRNEVDAFMYQRLQGSGLRPSPPADPRSLVRRLYFDLIGLPPPPEEVAAFVGNPSEAAYQRLVNDLLRSPHYGERWGRHWLDVVRFGESDGFERNHPRENAWHYRDWVINALNEDLPYNEFVRHQLIGDQLLGEAEGAAATGFWVAGVHNTTVGGSKRMKQLARHDELEEVLATVGQTFVGLTFHCARCHDHKFDPITQTEYYQLSSAISGLGYGEREVSGAQEAEKLAQLHQQLTQQQAQLTAFDAAARQQVLAARTQGGEPVPQLPAALARWEFDTDLNDSLGPLHGKAQGKARLEQGALILDGASYVETAPLPNPLREKTLEVWVELSDLTQRGGAPISLQERSGSTFDAIVFGELEPARWMAGSNHFLRTESFAGTEETQAGNRSVHVALVYQQNGTILGYRNGVAYGRSIRKAELQPFPAESTEVLFGLRHKPSGGNRLLKGKIHRAALYDRALTPKEVAAAAGTAAQFVSEAQLVASLSETQRHQRASLQSRIAELQTARDRSARNAKRMIYTLTASDGQATHVLLRGDPDQPGELVSPAATAAIVGLSPHFELAPHAPEAERRRRLAQWITHENNPLFARVMVNRVWHYHLGVGLVDTPNDFGFNGGRPTHPELLEYLAWQFQQHNYQLKWLHRLIVNSSTYRQATHGLPNSQLEAATQLDATNRLLWRGNPRRLEAESLRDAILRVSGKLNHAAGGPSFKDVSVLPNSGTTYYEPIDVDGPEFFRRTVFRFNPRGGRSALLDTFDCPDPASTAPRRSVTTTPLQSLSLLNNSLVLRMSNYFAQRVQAEVGQDIAQQVNRVWQLALARDPNETERQLSEHLVAEHGLPALCRGMFNLHEFVVIE